MISLGFYVLATLICGLATIFTNHTDGKSKEISTQFITFILIGLSLSGINSPRGISIQNVLFNYFYRVMFSVFFLLISIALNPKEYGLLLILSTSFFVLGYALIYMDEFSKSESKESKSLMNNSIVKFVKTCA